MSKKPNRTKDKYIESLSDKALVFTESAKNITFTHVVIM